MRRALPPGKILSVAAYPPPTWMHPYPDVHWDGSYFREVSRRTDQMAVMMYDTGLSYQKFYRNLMRSWTQEVLDGSDHAEILLGLPAYDDAGAGYHDPKVENLENAMLGIHAALNRYDPLPARYQGVALYSEWEMDDAEWDYFEKNFLK